MKRFGKYATIEPVEYHFKHEPDLYWRIKPPTSGDELEIARFLNTGRVTIGPDGATRDAPPSWLDIAHRELALTFAGTNIPASDGPKVEDGGPPFISVGADVPQIEACLRVMPQEMVLEIWNALADAIIGWGPKDPKAETKSEPEASSTPS